MKSRNFITKDVLKLTNAASTDTTRPLIMCIHIDTPNQLAVAVDGHILVTQRLEVPKEIQESVPRFALAPEACKVLAKIKGLEDYDIEIDVASSL